MRLDASTHQWKWLAGDHRRRGVQGNGLLGLFAEATPPSPAASSPTDPSAASDDEPNALGTTGLPVVLILLLLGIELVVATGVGMLGLWCGAMAQGLTQGLLLRGLDVDPRLARVGGAIARAAVFSRLLLVLLGKFFRVDRELLVTRLGLWSRPSRPIACASLVVHATALASWYWTTGNALPCETIADWGPAWLETAVLIPWQEELFFRVAVLHVALNRLDGRIVPSCVVSALGFALVHLANARHLNTTLSELALQLTWALLVGGVLALLYVDRGALLNCLVVHSMNNLLAAVLARSSVKTSTIQGPTVWILCVGYVAGGRHLYKRLRRHHHVVKNEKESAAH